VRRSIITCTSYSSPASRSRSLGGHVRIGRHGGAEAGWRGGCGEAADSARAVLQALRQPVVGVLRADAIRCAAQLVRHLGEHHPPVFDDLLAEVVPADLAAELAQRDRQRLTAAYVMDVHRVIAEALR
jgi:hypothetical protein